MQALFRNTTLPALEQTAIFADRRHHVLAGNIANLDTPDYIARDLPVGDFQSALSEALRRDDYRSGSRSTHDSLADVGKEVETLMYHDGSQLNLERQVTEMSKNQHLHNLAISLMRSQMQTLQTAISERVV